VVHHIGPLTGVLAASNEEALGGARLFLDGLNARGGVGGRQVTMQSIDDAQDAAKSKALLDKLIADRQLLALMMPRTTPSMEAMLPAVGANGIPVVGPQTGAAFVNNPVRREVFTLRASYQKEAEVALRQQVSIGVRRIGLLLADDAFGKDVMLAVDRVMVELQVKPLASAKIDNRKAEVSEAVDTILAARPEVVLLVVSGKSAAAFIKEYRKKGGNATFISLSNTSNADYVTALGDQARGAIVMQIMPSPYSAATALAREYAAAAAAKKVPPSYAGLYGYASAKLLALGLAKAGREPTPASLVQALEGLGEFDLGGFRVKYGPGQRVGSTFVDSTIINSQGRFMR
jgi:ABC-type branched-subunit amino acid transport system substrate-binding protein